MSNLRCRDLYKNFGGTAALDGVSIDFPASGIVALVGTNGAGKSTLISVLGGQLEPDRGACTFGGKGITGLAPYRISRLGITRSFQRVRLFWDMSVEENILTAMSDSRARKHGARRVAELLDLVGLTDLVGELPRELSYGQQKLLAIACCVATEARVFLLDEPVAGLDPAVSARILTALVNLRASGKVIVFAEHNLQAVRDVAERVVVLSKGKVLSQGSPNEVLDDPVVVEDLIG
jgi:branched-chain amino acid transport system ATP-binding protein